MHAPAIARQRAGEPRDVRHTLVARAEEVALGIGEVGIPAVDEVRRIADALQLRRDPREATQLGGHLHHRVAREARVATEQADRAAVGAVAIGIAALEAYALTR